MGGKGVGSKGVGARVWEARGGQQGGEGGGKGV